MVMDRTRAGFRLLALGFGLTTGARTRSRTEPEAGNPKPEA